MKKILFVISLVLLISLGFVNAYANELNEHNFTEVKQLINSKTSCDKLTNEQLEEMGDYYMEQMHPGESHELMDQMMGGEGSTTLKQMHIQMAKRLYCNENVNMMNMMMGGNMMGMMNGGTNMMNYGMMGNWGYGYWGLQSILYTAILIGLVILVYLWIIKLWKSIYKKK